MPVKITCPECHGDGITCYKGVVGPCDLCNGSGKSDEETQEEHDAFVNKIVGILHASRFELIVMGNAEHRPSEDLDLARPGNTCAVAAAFDNVKGGKRRHMNGKEKEKIMNDDKQIGFMVHLYGEGILNKNQAIDITTCPTEGVDLNELVKHKRVHIDWKKRVYLMPLGQVVVLGEIIRGMKKEREGW